MMDFFRRAEQLYDLGKMARFESDLLHIRRLRGRLKQATSSVNIDLDNLESVFNAIEMADTLGSSVPLLCQDGVDYRRSLVRVIVETLEQTQQFQVKAEFSEAEHAIAITEKREPKRYGELVAPKGYDAIASLAAHLAKGSPKHRVSFLTFNYDLGLDVALRLAKLDVNYHLGESYAEDAISVFKLHGSVNWFQHKQDKSIRPLAWLPQHEHIGKAMPWSGGGATSFLAPRSADLEKTAESFGCELEPWIVPPSESKRNQRDQLRSVWRCAADRLRRADAIAVFGYSMPSTDHFFQQFLAMSLMSDRVSRGFWLFDPSEKVQRRFARLLGPHLLARYVPHSFGFTDAVYHLKQMIQISGNTLWGDVTKESEIVIREQQRRQAFQQRVKSFAKGAR